MSIVRNRPSVRIDPASVGPYDLSGLPTRFLNPGELELLMYLFSGARTIVEFGVNEGRNAAAAFRVLPGVELYVGVDVPPGYRSQLPVQRKETPAAPGVLAREDKRFELVLRPRGTFDLTPEDLPEADVVFIDADHSAIGVENDYRLARAIIRPGGVIVFHDDNCLPQVEVTQTLNRFVDDGATIEHIEGTWISYERY